MKLEFILVTEVVKESEVEDENGNKVEIVETVETTKSTYIINDISYNGIFYVDDDGVSHIWRTTNYTRQSDNYY
jgi:hypothetical protein